MVEKTDTLQHFEGKKIRTAWNEEKAEWYFSIVDVVGALTDSFNPTDYLKKMRKRDELLGNCTGTNCHQIDMLTHTGKTNAAIASGKICRCFFDKYYGAPLAGHLRVLPRAHRNPRSVAKWFILNNWSFSQ
jgi:hypothetical protein